MDATTILARNENIRWTNVGDEIVLMDPDSEQYWQLNPTASVVWELADTKSTIADMVAEIVAEFEAEPEDVERDVLELTTSMLEQGLLRLVGSIH